MPLQIIHQRYTTSKTQLSKTIHLGRFLRRLLKPLMKVGLPLMNNVFILLAKSVLISLGLTAAVLATDVVVRKTS